MKEHEGSFEKEIFQDVAKQYKNYQHVNINKAKVTQQWQRIRS